MVGFEGGGGGVRGKENILWGKCKVVGFQCKDDKEISHHS